MVYISNDAHDALVAYLKIRPAAKTQKLFLVEKGPSGVAHSVRGIQKRMEYYAGTVGLHISCHELRHTMATQFLNADAALSTIQDLLGHNWVTTTQRYCRVSNLKVQQDYYKAIQTVIERTTPEIECCEVSQAVFYPMLTYARHADRFLQGKYESRKLYKHSKTPGFIPSGSN